jgi:hypothetical protein
MDNFFKRPLVIISGLLLFLMIVYFGYRYYLDARIAQRLQAISKMGYPTNLIELDRMYTKPPVTENAIKELERGWSQIYVEKPQKGKLSLFAQLQKHPPGKPVPDEFKKQLEETLTKNKDALRVLHKGATLEQSFFAANLLQGVNTRCIPIMGLRQSLELLGIEAVFQRGK